MTNRLDNLSVDFLRRRGELADRLASLRDARRWPSGLLSLPPRGTFGGTNLLGDRPQDQILTERGYWGGAAMDAWHAVFLSPSREETEDLALFDDFFVGQKWGSILGGAVAGTFSYPTPTTRIIRQPADSRGARWGDVRRKVKNTIAILGALGMGDPRGGYPWPGAGFAYAKAWGQIIEEQYGSDFFVLLVESPDELGRDDVRTIVTLTLLRWFHEINVQVQSIIKRKVKRKKRIAVIRAVILIVVSIVLGVILSGAALTLARVALNQLDEQQQKKLAQSLAAIAKQFQSDFPEFSREVRRVADSLDPVAAEAGFRAEREDDEEEGDAAPAAAAASPAAAEPEKRSRPAGTTAAGAALTSPPRRLNLLDRAIGFLRDLFRGARRAG